ncbi:N-acetyl-beta-hexosaminidase [Sphaerochaeta pleomorpha str. Grapes]|uniref:beta-N-acetylhexosaminidase n=1 Tax=Sphaerochaeta pleomorpha (strain ATCC BAA-1885 / DSM 22778 / Grapes) TaxID=158190 RepID=G8QY04_SPHPG|nr:beta-N-acetylhexosaminidase [Sphaerochaeta pleomorpha]AEV28509.1 N-acetyl-beta-hexosaminidase [Sphaerochaeta pleomorpha str. Grapes]
MKKTLSIIPRPNGSVSLTNGTFLLPDKLDILIPSMQYFFAATQLATLLRSSFGTVCSVGTGKKNAAIQFIVSDDAQTTDSYHLRVFPGGCSITCKTPGGAFYAIQTLRQLADCPSHSFPCCEIDDYPAFFWRGFMLDATRSFCPVPELLRLMDLLSRLKLNVFHWHLSDDQGWRIAIGAYPLLTSSDAPFYTKKQIKQVVAYASQRNITIVPEIDMPGHFMAALVGYPQFSCTGGPFSVPKGGGIFSELLCMGNDEALVFARTVIAEICDLFPGPYIHLGGDEIPLTRWKTCPKCQKRIKELQLQQEEGLLSWFTNQMAVSAREKGKRVIVWNDSVQESYDPSIACQIWSPLDFGRQGVLAGRICIMSDYFHTYLDLPHSMVTVHDAYQYGHSIQNLAGKKYTVPGSEFLLWTEKVYTRKQRDKHMFPRLVAGSEALWTESGLLDWKQFRKNLKGGSKKLFPSGVSMASRLFWNPPVWYSGLRKKIQRMRVRHHSRKSGIVQ